MVHREIPPPKPHRFESDNGKYLYWLHQINDDEERSEWWIVRNIENGKVQSCSSKLACEKIIRLCEWLESKPLNHFTLERKARNLV